MWEIRLDTRNDLVDLPGIADVDEGEIHRIAVFEHPAGGIEVHDCRAVE